MDEMKFIDIHTHIIPRVDDGSRSIFQSLEMLEKMIKQGVTDVIATPHVNSNATTATWEMQTEQFKILKEKASHLNINLYLGAEVKYRQYLATDYKRNKIEGTDYILVEFNWNTKEDVHKILSDFQQQGLKPIIAHVERYSYLTLEDYKILKDNGILLQVNTGSILDNTRKIWNDNANILLNEKLADFIATDAHDSMDRPPNIKKAYEFLLDKLDQNYLKDLFYNNPLKIIKLIKG